MWVVLTQLKVVLYKTFKVSVSLPPVLSRKKNLRPQWRAFPRKVIIIYTCIFPPSLQLRGWQTTTIELLAPVAFVLLLLIVQAIPSRDSGSFPLPSSTTSSSGLRVSRLWLLGV